MRIAIGSFVVAVAVGVLVTASVKADAQNMGTTGASGRTGAVTTTGDTNADTPGKTGLGNTDNAALGGATRGPGTARDVNGGVARPGEPNVKGGAAPGGSSVPGSRSAAGAGGGDAPSGAGGTGAGTGASNAGTGAGGGGAAGGAGGGR